MNNLVGLFKEFIGQVDLNTATICPSHFSDDVDRHDCDICPASEFNLGDIYDYDVCVDCWRRAIDTAARRQEVK